MHFDRTKKLVAILLVALLLALSGQLSAAVRSNVQTWLKLNKLAANDGFMVSRVHMIFEDIKRASDVQTHPSKLFIIQSNSVPWAIALEDRNVILTSGAIDVIYAGDDSLDKKDARMAFVLGHELKHVVENDFSHEQAYNSFSDSATSDLLASNASTEANRKTLELLADEEGLINASLAGYDTSAIFSGTGGAGNFLEYWANQTNTNLDRQHHSPKERIEYLQQRYRSINNLVEFFKYGVRLSHFGEQEVASALLDDFYKIYESKRVLANRGYVHLQLARAAMPEAVAYQYWYPDMLELDSGFPVNRTRRFQEQLSAEATSHLKKAVGLLKAGVDETGLDTTARLNLITAYLYLGEYTAASAVMEKIAGWEAMPQLASLGALVIMHDKRLKDPWNTHSLDQVQILASDPQADLSLVYNYARLLSEHGRKKQANDLWIRLADNADALPRNYQVMVCRQLSDSTDCANKLDQYMVTQLQWDISVKPGDSIDSKKVRRKLRSWKAERIDSISGIDAQIYPDGKGNSLLVVDGKVKLVSLTQHGFQYKDELQEKFGRPQELIKTEHEEIWSYGPQWSALISGDRVREIWVAQ